MTKGPILQDIWDNLSDERKQRIQARVDQLEAQYQTNRSALRWPKAGRRPSQANPTHQEASCDRKPPHL